MNRNRRETHERTRQRTMGNFISRGGQRSRVEISDDEDDEVEEINTQGFSDTAHGDRAARLRTRRQRREAAQDVQFQGDDGRNEEWELEQALLMSKMEAEQQEERRKMCGSLQDVMNLQVEIEPLSPSRVKSLATETARNTIGDEGDEKEYAGTPELFSTPPEDQEQLFGVLKAVENLESDTEFPNSPPLPVTVRSPDAVPNDEGGREKAASAGPTLRQGKGATRGKLKLRRTRKEESSLTELKEENFEQITDDELQSGHSEGVENVVHGEKRKLGSDDNDDVTDDESIPVLNRRKSLKRKKLSVFEENSDSDDVQDVEKKGSKRTSDRLSEPQPKKIAVDECDEKETENDNSTTMQKEPEAESRQQRTPSSLLNVRLSRRYKKPRCRPTTLKEAMKADLYFAPQGFNLPSYTLLIIKMFDKYRKRLHAAQSKVKTRIPLGPPVVCGNRQGNTLEVRQPGKTTTSIGGRSSAFVRGNPFDETSTEVKTQLEQDVFNRRRTLRSSTNPLNHSTASMSTSTATHETLPSYKVESDSDGDGDFMKSYLDEMMPQSVITSTKKTKRPAKNNGSSSRVFVEAHETMAQAPGEPSVKTQTSKNSNMGVSEDGKNANPPTQFNTSDTETFAKDGPVSSDMLFGANVVLDSNVSETGSNTFDTSHQTLGNQGNEAKSKTSENKLDGQTSVSKDEGLPEDNIDKDECFMDTDENQADIIRPPKHRSVLRSLDDDSTDDENDMSQPVFSLRFQPKEPSADSEMSSSKEENDNGLQTSIVEGGDEDISDNAVPLDSQPLTTQSESQGILGKSILETMSTDGETLLPSQALSEAGLTSHKLITETLEDSNTTKSSSSASRPQTKREKERCNEEEKFTVDVDSYDSQHMRQKRSEAAERAAAAAMRRQQGMTGGQETRGAFPSSSHVDFMSKTEGKTEDRQEEPTVECPLCYCHFTVKEIEAHASDCQGPPPSPPAQASYSHIQQGEASAQSRPRVISSAPSENQKSTIYHTLSGERGELKNLKVVLQRSPLAREKLRQKANQPTDSAKRNLDFEKTVRSSRSLDQYVRPLAGSSGSFDQGLRKVGTNTRAALRTESEGERSGYENEKEEDSSQVYSWLDSASPEKKKPQQTYAGNASKRSDDYIPLNMPEETDESEDNEAATRQSSKEHERKQASSRTEEIESDSDASDDDSLMVQYGAQRASTRRAAKPRQAETHDTDENELALTQLGGRSKKRPLSLSKSSKAKKSRRPRDSDSEDSDECTTVCHLCNEKIPKELYEQHAEEELEERKRTGGAPRKVEVITVKDRRGESSKGEQRRFDTRGIAHEDLPSQSSGTEQKETEDEIDWETVSNSPIRCFQFTENSNSVVDFENQFGHLTRNEKKGGRRRGNQERYEGSGARGGYRQSDTRGGYGEPGNRGGYRGSYNKVYGRGRGKKYRGKFKGSRSKK